MNKKEDRLFIERIEDLFEKSNYMNRLQYTYFLSLHEQSLLQQKLKYEPTVYRLMGGYALAERQCLLIRPGYDHVTQQDTLISVIRIKVKSLHAPTLTHRDFLGGLMNLGIERSIIGDIIVEDTLAHVFIMEHMGSYVCEQLMQIGRYMVESTIIEAYDFSDYQPTVREVSSTIASLRIDNLIKAAFNLSRKTADDYIKKGLVYINHSLVNKATSSISEDVIISVRGLGKCKLISIGHQTKKQRYHVTIHVYQ
jgi:RNA-binding protein YlmH